jgi:hypothetical protein
MYIQGKINQAFKIFCQDPSLENRDALLAECKDLIDVVLCTTPWVSEDPESKDDIQSDVMVLLMEFLDRRKDFDQIQLPTAFLNSFLKRNILNCLKARWPSEHPALNPDQLPVEKEGWTRFEDETTESQYSVAREKAEDRRWLKSFLRFFQSFSAGWRKKDPTYRVIQRDFISRYIATIKETLKQKNTTK